MKRALLLLAVVLGVVLTPVVARAAPDERVQQRVRTLVRRGQEAMREGRLTRALKLFRDAYKRWNRKEIQFNIALVHLELKNDLAAARHLHLYLAAAGPGARERLPIRFKKLLRKVAVLKVRVRLAGAAILVDGKRVGTGSARVVLLPGSHRVKIRVDGAVRVRTTLQLSAGQVLEWNPELWKAAPRPRRRRGVVPVKHAAPTRSWQRLHWAYFAVAVGVAAVAGGALVATGLKTNQLEDEFWSGPTPDLQSRGRTYLAATHALTGLTAAAGVTAVVLAIFTRWRAKPREHPLTVLPTVSPAGASLLLRWTPAAR